MPDAGTIILMDAAFVAAVMSFVMLFSAMFKNPLISVILTLVTLIVLMPIMISNYYVNNLEPSYVLYYAATAISALALKTYPQHAVVFSAPAGSPTTTLTTFTPYIGEAFIILAGYIAVCLILSWIIYYRKEFK